MAADKRKILEAARKHAQKGARDKALKEFGKLLKLDPRDAKLRLEVGDTYRRWGQIDEAIEAYSAVAQQYMQEGFDARAVAVFKQIQNLQPDSFGAYEQLAELYQRMGLAAEAIGCLEAAAEGYRKAGQKQQALGLLRKMAAIDPSNTTSRIKVADLLHQEGMKQEALAEYDAVLGELELQGDSEAAAKVFERILEIDPGRVETIARYARNLIEQNAAPRAESLAKRALEIDRSPEHFELLADVYRLQKRDDDLVALYRELAELYRERGDEERTREILQRYVPLEEIGSRDTPHGYIDEDEKLAADGDLDDLSIGDETTLLDEDLLADPNLLVSDDDSGFGMLGGGDLDDLETDSLSITSDANERTRLEPDAPPAASRVESRAEDVDADISQLLAEASVYLRYGKRSQAIANLESILVRDLDHRPALEKLGEAYAAGDQAPKAVEMWSRAARLAAAAGEAQSAEVLRTRIAALDRAAAEALDLSAPSAPEPDDSDELSIPSAPGGGALRADAEPFDDSDLPELDLAEVSVRGTSSGMDVEIDIDDASFAEPSSDDEASDDASGAASQSGSLESAGFDEIRIDDISSDGDVQPQHASDASAVDADALTAAPASASGASAAKLAEELEEANFYLEQGMLDEAEAIYSRIVEAAPGHPLAMVRLGEIAARRGEAAEPPRGAAAVVAEDTEPDAGSADSLADDAIGEDLANWQDEPSVEAAPPAQPPRDEAAPERARAVEARAQEPIADAARAAAVTDLAADAAPDSASDLASELVSDLASDLGLGDTGDLDAAAGVDASADATAPPPEQPDDEQDETGEIPRSGSEPAISAEPPPAALAPSEPAPVSAAADPAADDGGDGPGFDLAAELSESLDRDPGSSASGTDRGKGRRSTADDGFASVFAEFKKGVSAALSEGDYQAHYDLGIAYREMGLFHDAINELRLAMGDPERRVGCLHLLGMCAQEVGEPEQAIDYFQQALASEGLVAETVLAIKLDLGKAHEASGGVAAARAVYEEIRAIDPDFADVAARLAELAKHEAAEAHDEASAVTDEYESFDEFLGDLDDPEPGDTDTTKDQAESPAAAPSWENFDDVVAEAEGGADAEPTEQTPKRRRKKISFV
ncbi:MAG TPA: tetratricopeptide repeat protein [Myxococcota bacterium]|nr:tetratricopeptide repeat protein [Myxococcota bacterium]